MFEREYDNSLINEVMDHLFSNIDDKSPFKVHETIHACLEGSSQSENPPSRYHNPLYPSQETLSAGYILLLLLVDLFF